MDNNVLNNDPDFKKGEQAYFEMIDKAQEISEEITADLVQRIVTEKGNDDNNISLSIAILACARAMVNLSSYAFNNEDEYKKSIEDARRTVVEKVIPGILDPQPCGECEACKKGEPCINPVMNTEMLQTRTTPMIGDALIEYDLWNKIIYMYTDGKEILDGNSIKVTEDEASEDIQDEAFEKNEKTEDEALNENEEVENNGNE